MNNLSESALKTDLYELTMAAGYFLNNVDLKALFELYCFKLPENRSYLVAAGLEQAADFILNLSFTDDEIAFLKSHAAFRPIPEAFFSYLKRFKFTGDVWAAPEGSVIFAKEPIIQICAPIIEAQILETYLLSTIHIQTLVATKASRVVRAACIDGKTRPVIDFGSRRAHGPEAAHLAARAAYIAGCAGTSNVYAGKRYGIPIYGTMAHSWVEAFDSEKESYLKYNCAFPENTLLLIDTYDTISGARIASSITKDLKAVRLDSGDLCDLSRRVRKILDNAGLKATKIIASGGLNEYKIAELVEKSAPIDIFGVGTEMVTSLDYPSLDLVYKLVEVARRDGRLKRTAKSSTGKMSLPGRKQVFRKFSTKGKFEWDEIDLFSSAPPADCQKLLEPVIENGKLVKKLPAPNKIREACQRNLASLGERYFRLKPAYHPKPKIGKALKAELRKFKTQMRPVRNKISNGVDTD